MSRYGSDAGLRSHTVGLLDTPRIHVVARWALWSPACSRWGDMNRSRFALTISTVTLAALTTTGCAILGIGGTSSSSAKKPRPPAPKSSSFADRTYEITVQNDTGSDICRLHAREDALGDSYKWSTNILGQQENPEKIPAGTSIQIRVYAFKPFSKPDVHALGCADETLMRVYDKPAFASATGTTWTISTIDEGTIADMQAARGITPAPRPSMRSSSSSSSSGIIEVVLENKCGSTVGYCRDGVAKSESTLNSGSSTRIAVNDGDKIMSEGCSSLIHTVSSASNGQTITLCK